MVMTVRHRLLHLTDVRLLRLTTDLRLLCLADVLLLRLDPRHRLPLRLAPLHLAPLLISSSLLCMPEPGIDSHYAQYVSLH